MGLRVELAPLPAAPRWARVVTALGFGFAALATARALWLHRYGWTDEERAILADLCLTGKEAPRPDPTNRFADDPRAAALGAKWFRDAALSQNGHVACNSCHAPEHAFADDAPFSRGLGQTKRNSPSVVAAPEGHWFFWDGRRDSQWAQALTPLESEAEHGSTRTDVVRHIATAYAAEYQAVFGTIPELRDEARFPPGASPLGSPEAKSRWLTMTEVDRDAVNRAFSNVGKGIAAYERTLRFSPSRFDRFVDLLRAGDSRGANAVLDERERNGLRLFIGNARCVTCHSGSRFSSFNFFSVGAPDGEGGEDRGRADVFDDVQRDPFNCLGKYSDGQPEDCAELRYMAPDAVELFATFKVPSLRNVAETAPYGHAAQFRSLDEVVAHYARAPKPRPPRHTDVLPLELTHAELDDLVLFLRTLSSSVSDPLGETLDRGSPSN